MEGLHEGSYEHGYRQYLFDFQSWKTVDKLRGKSVIQRLRTFFPQCTIGPESELGSCAYLLREVYDAMLFAYGKAHEYDPIWSAPLEHQDL